MAPIPLFSILTALVCAACGSSASNHAGAPGATVPARLSIARATDLGPLPQPPPIVGRDGGMSALFADRSVWVFGDTVYREPSQQLSMVSSTWSWTRDLDASDGIEFVQPFAAEKSPIPLLELSPAEQKFNDEHSRRQCRVEPCGVAWALWPSGLIADPAGGQALLFYGRLLVGPEPLQFSRVEHFIAGWECWERPAARAAPTGGLPTAMFGNGEPGFGAALFTEGDLLYAYGCSGGDGLRKPCFLARVPFEAALDRSAWKFFSMGGWTSELANAAPVFDGNGILSVAYNRYLSAYLAVYTPPLSNRVLMRTAPRPEGPWSNPIEAFATATPARLWVYDAQAHHEFERDDGRFVYVTYTVVTSEEASAMRLVEVELDRD
jgi:hypothetical protein